MNKLNIITVSTIIIFLLRHLFGWDIHRYNMGFSPSNIEQDGAGNNGQCVVYVTKDFYLFGIRVDSEAYWEEVDCMNAG